MLILGGLMSLLLVLVEVAALRLDPSVQHRSHLTRRSHHESKTRIEVAEGREEAYLDLTFTLGHILVGRITHWLFSAYLVGFM